MDYCIVHGVTKSRTWLRDFHLPLYYVQNTQVFIRFLAKNPPVSVKFCCQTLYILLHFTLEFLGSVRFYLRTSYFLSDFTSEPLSFCQIFTAESYFLSDFCLRTLKFLSHLTSEPSSFCQIWPQNVLRFCLSDFTWEPTSFCQILPENPLVSVRFYLRMS